MVDDHFAALVPYLVDAGNLSVIRCVLEDGWLSARGQQALAQLLDDYGKGRRLAVIGRSLNRLTGWPESRLRGLVDGPTPAYRRREAVSFVSETTGFSEEQTRAMLQFEPETCAAVKR